MRWAAADELDGIDGLTGAVLATQAIANVVKSSFGPSGLDKMMVDDIGVSTYTDCPSMGTLQLSHLPPYFFIDEATRYYITTACSHNSVTAYRTLR